VGDLPRDGNHEIDGRADIYSLAVVIYELIAGQRPFMGFSLPELRRQHTSHTPPSLHEVDASVPQAFSDAVARAIAKDRSDRQATAGELEKELLAALAAEGIAPSNSVADFSFSAGSPASGGTDYFATADRRRWLPASVKQAPVRVPSIASQAATMPKWSRSPAHPAPPVSPAPLHRSDRQLRRRSREPRFKSKGRTLIFAGVGLVVLLLIAGVGGYFVMHTMMNKPEANVSANGPIVEYRCGAEVVGAHRSAVTGCKSIPKRRQTHSRR
jgi:serine/threonine protein kinase